LPISSNHPVYSIAKAATKTAPAIPPLATTLAPALEEAFTGEDEVVELLLVDLLLVGLLIVELLDVLAAVVVYVLAYVVP
jgi:hypothetical protein